MKWHHHRRFAELNPTEIRIAGGIAEGLSNQGIALRLTLWPSTVNKYVSGIYKKLGLQREGLYHQRARLTNIIIRAELQDRPDIR